MIVATLNNSGSTPGPHTPVEQHIAGSKISTLLIILGAKGAEDFQEGIDTQHIIDQSGFSTDP